MTGRSAAGSLQTTGSVAQAELPTATIVPQITSDDTAGNYTVFDYVMPPHFDGPPLHSHARTTEWCYVVSGTLVFALNDETITVERSDTLLIPPEVAHTFWNPTPASAHLLVIATPGGLDRYYAELDGAIMAGSPNAVEERAAFAARYDVSLCE
jgi:quercetin dioxygenase-like cupin family protein